MKMNNNMTTFFNEIKNNDKYDELKNILHRFKKEKDLELEISFEKLDYQNFIRIIKYYINNLDEKNIFNLNTLDICVVFPNNNTYRISLLDENDIQKFIERYINVDIYDIETFLLELETTDNIQIMLKNTGAANKLYFEDYNMLFKLTPETLVKNIKKNSLIGNEEIFYRYKQRASFNIDSKVRIDITDVKQSKNLSSLNTTSSHYEIEMEIVNKNINMDNILKELYEILKIIKNTTVPISKKEEFFVINEYKKLLGIKYATSLENRNVISLDVYHIINYIPNRYAVTDKADGERFFLFSTINGIYLLSNTLSIKKINLSIDDKKYYNMILDGEFVKNKDNKNIFLVFDLVYFNNIDYRYNNNYTLKNRLTTLNNIIDKCFGTFIPFVDYASHNNDLELDLIKKYYTKELKKYWNEFNKIFEKYDNDIFITRKLYFIPYGINSCEVFMYADMIYKLYIYDSLTPYAQDGIIYTPINSPYMIKVDLSNIDIIPVEYKWKKLSQNSIDFYIIIDKDDNGNEIIYYDNTVINQTGRAYKICNLFVGINKSGQEKPVPFKINDIEQKANIYLSDGEIRDRDGNLIQDKMVVEFIFDNTYSNIPDQYKWIPIRIRYDKTESVKKYGTKYGNNLNIALRIWKTIINPITEEDIASLGNPNTYQKEIDKLSKTNDIYQQQNFIYYIKQTSSAIGMRSFNNWIKLNMILTYCKGKNNVLDIGCGRGGDIQKFIQTKINEYIGIDIDYNGLYIINDSAYNRYMNLKKTVKNVPEMYFINADARAIFTLKAQKSALPNMTKENKYLIEKFLINKKFDIFNCQFSLHYYLSDELSWTNFCTNINNHLDDDGYILITCFDGKLIYDKLMEKQKLTISYIDNLGNKNTFLEILKLYNDKDINENQIGIAIDVYNSLISHPGTYIREYLVFSDFLKKSLEENCNMELIETDSFFNLFNLYKNFFIEDNTYDFMVANTSQKKYNEIKDFYMMLDPKFQYKFPSEQVEANMASFKLSMLNRYYIFKKHSPINTTEPARIVGINNKFNIGRILTPYFDINRIVIDPSKKTTKLNKLYHAIRKRFVNIQPDVYLIKHDINEENLEDDTYRWNKINFTKIKEGNDDKIFLVYKSPEKYFYPIYYQNSRGNQYLLNSTKVIDDLNILVELSKKII